MTHPALSPRQRDVLALVADGLTDAEIGSRLAISRHTVHNHVSEVLARLGARNRAHAVAIISAGAPRAAGGQASGPHR